jgi:hypothetical protein
MELKLYQTLAILVLLFHLLWIVWVMTGVLLTRNRPLLGWFHIASLVYSAVIDAGPWPCPLTLAEQWLWAKAGMASYQGSFLVHYLEAVVYPDVPEALLTWGASTYCLLILGIYGLRLRRSKATDARTRSL